MNQPTPTPGEGIETGARLSSTSDVESIDIRPEVSVLGVFRYLNYRPWFAAAEFVDNAIQSFQDHQHELTSVEGHTGKLLVKVKIDTSDDGFIQVSDNAAGIYREEWARALRPAEPPPDTSGLAEFGMGMKTAAAWFGRRLTVRSKALGEPFRREITLDFNEIIEKRLEKVQPETFPAPVHEHGTDVIVSGLHRQPYGKTISKIREHLASIYRMFLREGSLELVFQHGTNPEQPLVAEEVDIFQGPRFDDPDGEHKLWSKPIGFDLGGGLHAHGFLALRAVGSTATAGLALFRRKRLIEGSGDETYRPRAMFGASNSYEYQRLFGELTLEGFEISHTKDGFRWEEHEEPFVDLLREYADAEPLPLIRQARGLRTGARRSPEPSLSNEAQSAAAGTVSVLGREFSRSTVGELVPTESTLPDDLSPGTELFPATIELEYRSRRWRVTVEISNELSHMPDWFEIAEHLESSDGDPHDVIRLRMSLRHPFSERYVGVDYENLELLTRFAAGLAIAEITARQAGARQAGEVRRRLNDLLGTVFSKP